MPDKPFVALLLHEQRVEPRCVADGLVASQMELAEDFRVRIAQYQNLKVAQLERAHLLSG